MPKSRVQEKSKDFFGSMNRLLGNLRPWAVIMVFALCLAMISAVLALVAPNKLSDFADEIGKGLVPRTENFEKISKNMYSNFNEQSLGLVYTSSSIPQEDLVKFSEVMGKMKDASDEDKTKLFAEIPDSILEVLLKEFEIDGVKITVKDQIEMMHLMKNVKIDEKNSSEALKIMEQLPESIYSVIEPKMDMDSVKSIAIFMAILYIASALFSFIQNFSMTTVSNRFAYKLRSSISGKINRLPLKYFDSHETGDILSRVTNDIDTIGHNLNNSLSTLVSSGTLFIGSIFMMFYTNWIMALTAIFASLIGFVFMFGILSKSQKYFARSQKALGDLNGYIEENYSGHNVVKAYNGTKDATKEFEILNNELYEAKRKSIFLSGTMQPLMVFIGNLGYVAVCIVGALLAMNDVISFGVIVAFMIYVRLFTNPLSQIAQALTNLQSTAAASERVFEFLDEKEMAPEGFTKKLKKDDIKGNIEFKKVKFGYDDNKLIIKDFSAKANSGQKIAIVGPTGAGKTTIVNLLMRFYEINNGDIVIDGISTKDLKRDDIHKLFIMVLQDTWLFEGTVRDNIKFNKKKVTDEEIWKTLKVVGVDHFVKTLPNGLDTILKDDDSISAGQKQLLTIARGMICDAPFLILDEATSNVDTRTEELVQKAMDKLTIGRTSFIIAHRLSTIKNADLILVMKEGNIIEQGNHDELLKQNGFYAELYNSQFKK